MRGERKDLVLWNAIPGEPAEVHVFHEGMNQDLGRVLRPAGAPHPLRRDPPCERFNPCGGCPLMHLVPEGAARARLSIIRSALREQDLEALAPTELVASPDGEEDFRHITRLAVGLSDHGHIRVGAHGRGSRRVVPVPDCNVVTPTLRQAMKVVAHHVIDLEIYPFDPSTGRGLLRYVVLRQSRSTGEVLVTLVASRRLPLLWELAERIAGGLSEVAGVHLHVNDGPGNAIFLRDSQGTSDSVRLRGREVIEESLAGVRLRVGPGDFYQTNPGMADRIANDLLASLEPLRARPIVDLYSGVGALTLALGAKHGYAIGVEAVEGAVERARENAALNRVAAEFIAGDVGALLPEVQRRMLGTAPVVVVDPARRGLSADVAEGILALEPAQIAYLSCNPRSLSRDLASFTRMGWHVESLRAYDMFPQTAHVELLALLSPAEPASAERRAPRRRIVGKG